MNPARALGPAFVLNRWDNHWVYWIGPISGGAVAALLHTYVLSSKKLRDSRDIDDGENSSMRSDEDTYDDLEKQASAKFPGTYAMYRPVTGASSLYGAPPTAIERVESLYGGTKSLYCKSPPLTRANLNRSQSVYAKSTSGRETLMLPKPGPLMPAQSLYPIRIGQHAQGLGRDIPLLPNNQVMINPTTTQNHNSANQNMQNQLQQCNQSIYGIRGITTSLSTRENGIYGMSSGGNIYGRAPAQLPERTLNPQQQQQNGPLISQSTQQQSPSQHQQLQNTSASGSSALENGTSSRRPESMYGHASRRSDDSAYGSYQGSTKGNQYGKVPGPPPPPVVPGPTHQYHEQMRPSPGPLQQNQSQQSYHRNSPIANSPNPQY